MSWDQFHKNDPVTYDDSICNFGRVFYHDTKTDMVQIVIRYGSDTLKGWKFIRRPAKDVRRTIPVLNRWTIEDVFNIPKENRVHNTSPVGEESAGYCDNKIAPISSKINTQEHGYLAKILSMLRLT